MSDEPAMNARELWDRYRRWIYDNPELGFRLDVSRMDLPEDYVGKMGPRMDAAFKAMRELENGGLANPDEGRMVGHYWLRAPQLSPSEEIATAIRETLERILVFSGEVRQRFEHVLVIGVGGSALGPQFVSHALGGPGDAMDLHFLDNTDPDGIQRVLGNLGDRLDRTLTVVISKSGGTPETRNGMLETAAAYRASGLDFGRHAVAITQEGSKLDALALDQNFLARFPMWDWVGGRTSELSAVGLLPAALQGIDVRGMIGGAAAMDEATRPTEVMTNPAALLALAWFHAGGGKGSRDMVILPYRDRLALLSRYLQQLVMESLGKQKDLDGRTVHQGIAVYGNKGSTDQHAYVQQLRDGLPNFFVTFVEVLRDGVDNGIEVEPGVTSGDYLHGFLLGTRRALYENGRPSLTLTVNEVSPRSVGMLIALFERAVGFYAMLVNVNAYHQPGVEAGKRAAASVLELQRGVIAALGQAGDAGATCEELARAMDAVDEVETVFRVLEHLAADPGRGVTRTPGPSLFEATYRLGNRR